LLLQWRQLVLVEPMVSPRVFISHSCKDAELAGAPPADAATLARRARLTYARTVRTLVKDRLEAAGFEVLLDVARLEPSDEWRAKLHFWLETCDAAVILLNPESVASPWVRKEVDILMHRWTVSRSFESEGNRRLRIVPVFLGAFGDADIRAAGFGDLEILSVQAARVQNPDLSDANATQLADVVASGLKGLTPVTRDPNLRRWLDSVSTGLKQAQTKGESFLDEARKRARVSDAHWATPASRVEVLAHHLLHCDLETVKAVLAELRPAFLNAPEYQAFASRLLPLWVDSAPARGLVEARTRVDADRAACPALALNAGQYETVRDYVNRAWSYPSWGNRCAEFEPTTGEGGDAEVLAQLQKILMTAAGARPPSPNILTNFLSRDPFFVTIGAQEPPSGDLLRAMAGDYPTVTFVLLGGTEFGALPKEDVVARVQPPLSKGVEDTATATKHVILQLQ
jgi:TIR domain